MRQIKYRQYIGNGNWHYWGYLEEGVFTHPLVSIEGKSPSQQLTPFKDKNGKEIYEGDIIGYWGGKKKDVAWTVGWDDNKSCLAAVYGDLDVTNLGESMSGRPAFKLSKKLCAKKENIGNIYDNSDLLK